MYLNPKFDILKLNLVYWEKVVYQVQNESNGLDHVLCH